MNNRSSLALVGLLTLGAMLIAEPAFAQLAGAFQAGGQWLVNVMIGAGVVIVIIGAAMILSGRTSLVGLLPIAGGLYIATHPQEVVALITG